MNKLIKWFLLNLTSENWEDKVSEYKLKIESGEYDQNYPELKDEFKVYLEQFDWENKITEVTEIQWKEITLIDPENDGKSLFGYDPIYHEEPYNIFYRSDKEHNFYKQILSQPILLQDLNLVRKLLKVIIKKLGVKSAFIGSQGYNFINKIYNKTNEFVSSGLKERFYLNLLDYINIDLIDNPDIRDVWSQFKKLWNEKYEEINSNTNLSEGKKANDISSKLIKTLDSAPGKKILHTPSNSELLDDHNKMNLSEEDQATIIAALNYLKVVEKGVYKLSDKKKVSIRAVLV